MQCDLEERLTVMGDRDHLYRVVYNLTDNAVKFIEDGGTLRLKVHQEGQLCVFAISNTGIGISAEDLPHVFDRFYKTDRSRSMDKTGAGLGLYIVKNIINLHGGEIPSARAAAKPSSSSPCRSHRSRTDRITRKKSGFHVLSLCMEVFFCMCCIEAFRAAARME